MSKIKIKYVGDLSGIKVNSYKIKRGEELEIYEGDWEKYKNLGFEKIEKEKKEKVKKEEKEEKKKNK